MSVSPQRSKRAGSFCPNSLSYPRAAHQSPWCQTSWYASYRGWVGSTGAPAVPQLVLVDEPTAGAEAGRHLPDRLLLAVPEVEQHESGADQVERPGLQLVERVVEDVVLHDLEVGKVQPGQVPGVEVGRDHLAVRTHLLGQPDRHGAAPGTHLETPPSGLDQRTSSARGRVVDLLEEIEPVILGGLPPGGGQPIVRTISGTALLVGVGHARQRIHRGVPSQPTEVRRRPPRPPSGARRRVQHRRPVLEQLQTSIEETAVQQLQLDVGVLVVDPFRAGRSGDHREHDHPVPVDQPRSQQ